MGSARTAGNRTVTRPSVEAHQFAENGSCEKKGCRRSAAKTARPLTACIMSLRVANPAWLDSALTAFNAALPNMSDKRVHLGRGIS